MTATGTVTGTLADYWATLCPALPQAWDTSANRESLLGMARRMAPIPRVALECRLGDAEPQLDLQQCVVREEDEPALLRDFLRSTHPAGGAWAGLHRFCQAWAEPASVLHRSIAEVFLEYDLDGAAQPVVTPSVFFSVGSDRRAVARAALEKLFPGSSATAGIGHLERCFDRCPPGAAIEYLGAMLSRSARGLRVNIKRLHLDDLVPFLSDIGWGGSLSAAEDWASWAYDQVDRVTLCLDVAEEIYPHLGLECVLALQPSAEPRWRALLDECGAAGLCSSENAAAILSVPSVLRPPETDVAWPARWIAGDLCGPTDRFSTTERRLSHLKLTVRDRQAVLKGYWGAGHVWRGPELRDGDDKGARDGSVGQALGSAVDYLVSRQSHTGRWSDFLMPAGPSDEWVTAFVGACLLDAPGDAARVAARRACGALVVRRRDEAGWGYNRLTPADADSTTWALRLAAGLGASDEGWEAAYGFLAGHLLANGGITTYAAGDPIRRFTGLPDDASMAGWQAAHACVTAAAAPIVGVRAATYLASSQGEDGSWAGYWWWEDEYTTALAAEAIPACRPRAVGWAVERVGTDGMARSTDGRPSPWATAWCVRILRLGTTPKAQAACQRAVRWLVGAQRPDGSWRASARLRVPMPGHLDPAEEEKRIEGIDHNRVFTTAAVAAALSLSAV